MSAAERTAPSPLVGESGMAGIAGVNPKPVPGHEAATANSAPAQASLVRAAAAHRVTHIVATSPWYETGLGEMARAYELLLVFTWRQIGVQYKQAVLGIGWALISPLVSTLVFTLIFGRLAAIPSEGLPYPLFVLSGLITWQYFARSITSGSNSILASSHIITKVYFPRMILPLSAVLAGLVDYAVNLVVLLVLMIFYGRAPGVELLLLPVFLLLATMIGFALSLWLSALNALYRDIGFMIPLALQSWMFLTPVIYPTALVPGGWTWLMRLNPMTVVVQGARWAVLPDAMPPDLMGLAILAGEFVLLFLGGVVTFHKIDAILADRI
jgi:lipopolysaccharide transport system permease protein